MTTYGFAQAGDEQQLLDLANMVFSMADEPTDFARLHPTVYGQPGYAHLHAVARQEGRIIATAALKAVPVRLGAGDSLPCGFIGTVCTHPRHAGQGHMRQLMRMLEARGCEQGMALLVLGGQRQRYQHHGFEQGGTVLYEVVRRRNLAAVEGGGYAFVPLEEAAPPVVDAAYALYRKQVMMGERERTQFVPLLRTWQAQGVAVLAADEPVGYLCAKGEQLSECVLADDARLPAVLKAWLAYRDMPQCTLTLPLHRTGAIDALCMLAEEWQLSDSLMLRVLDWPAALGSLLRFAARHRPLPEGQAVLCIEDEGCYAITVQAGRVTVAPSDKMPDAVYTHRAAVRRLFSAQGCLTGERDALYGWLPLPFSLPASDCF